jgi:hypothetical protein
MVRAWWSAMMLALVVACSGAGTRAAARGPEGARADPAAFLTSALRPWPRADSAGLIAVTDAATGVVATYDSALVVLALLRSGDRPLAARVLRGLAALQGDDGAIPFSFTLTDPDPGPGYVRSGAVAWVGYAAAEYLDAERGGPSRDVALALAHRAAKYLLARAVSAHGDPRAGLVRGGSGTLRYELDGDRIREILEPGEIEWTSVEHNVDAYFFLRALARVTDMKAYGDAADRIAGALVARAWRSDAGQFAAGVAADGVDATLPLDCASWGSVLLGAAGETERADTAYAVADARYATRDPRVGASGHKPYASGALIADDQLMRHFEASLPAATWDRFDGVWPEGSAGVALAAWRTGHAERAREILDALEPLRTGDGALPASTTPVPYLFAPGPSVAATAWVALVRFELDRPLGRRTLWAP